MEAKFGTKGKGRPPLDPAQKRSFVHTLKLNAAEEEQLRAHCAQSGRGFHDVMRALLMNQPIVVVQPAGLTEGMQRELVAVSRMGNLLKTMSDKPFLDPAERAFLTEQAAGLDTALTAFRRFVRHATNTHEELHEMEDRRRRVAEAIGQLKAVTDSEEQAVPSAQQARIGALCEGLARDLERLSTVLGRYLKTLEPRAQPR